MHRRDPLLLATAFLLLAAPVASAFTGFSASLTGANEVPANASTATGQAVLTLDGTQTQLTYSVTYSGLGAPLTASHIHKAPIGTNGPVVFNLNPLTGQVAGSYSGTITVGPADVADLVAGLYYINIHTTLFPGGEIRGQVEGAATPSARGSWGRIKALYR